MLAFPLSHSWGSNEYPALFSWRSRTPFYMLRPPMAAETALHCIVLLQSAVVSFFWRPVTLFAACIPPPSGLDIWIFCRWKLHMFCKWQFYTRYWSFDCTFIEMILTEVFDWGFVIFILVFFISYLNWRDGVYWIHTMPGGGIGCIRLCILDRNTNQKEILTEGWRKSWFLSIVSVKINTSASVYALYLFGGVEILNWDLHIHMQNIVRNVWSNDDVCVAICHMVRQHVIFLTTGWVRGEMKSF